MHCIILVNEEESFRPMNGRAVIDYLIDDAIEQKDITTISIVTHQKSLFLIKKHIKNRYPHDPIDIMTSIPLNIQDDVVLLKGSVFTSLKLADFIRYYKQFKTITKAAYDKNEPKEIPFYIIPQTYCEQIDQLPTDAETHTYNCGTGYNIT